MEVFVFPLGQTVFYPKTSKPLNIFEPRYLQMVKDSIALGVPIAVGFVDDPGVQHQFFYGQPLSFVRPVVGFGMPLIVEERADGSQLIFLQGKGKARLGKVLDQGTPYIVCEADIIDEDDLLDPSLAVNFLTLQKVLIKWLHNHIPDPHHRDQFIRNLKSPSEVVACVASYMVHDFDMQQLILEANSLDERIQLVMGLVSSSEAI